MRQEFGGALLATVGQHLGHAVQLGDLRIVVRAAVGGDELVQLLGVETFHGGRFADTARVPADHVELPQQRRPEDERSGGRELHPGGARAARVDEEGSDLAGPVAGRDLASPQFDRLAGRLLVVERHADGGAQLPGTAALPVRLLLVVRLQSLRNRPSRPRRLPARLSPRPVGILRTTGHPTPTDQHRQTHQNHGRLANLHCEPSPVPSSCTCSCTALSSVPWLSRRRRRGFLRGLPEVSPSPAVSGVHRPVRRPSPQASSPRRSSERPTDLPFG